MRAIQRVTFIFISICMILGTSQIHASDTKQKSTKTTNTKATSLKSEKHKASAKKEKQAAAKAKAEQAKAAKKKRQAADKAAKEKAKLAKQQAEKLRPSQPRSSFAIKMLESLNHGVVVASVYHIRNVEVSDTGVASAELEIRDIFNNVLRKDECSASEELSTDIKTDSYRLSCNINNKQRYSARLRVYDVAPGTYTGTARNTSDIPDVERYPQGIGAVNFSTVIADAPPTGVAVDCVVSDWTPFTACEGSLQTRTRTILVDPENGGQACGPLTETQFCF